MNIALFGCNGIQSVPVGMREDMIKLHNMYGGNVRFIVSDSLGFNRELHKVISSLGLIDKSVIYCMNECLYNLFELPIRVFGCNVYNEDDTGEIYVEFVDKGTGDVVGSRRRIDSSVDFYTTTQEYKEFRHRMICKDADCALVAWDGESKAVMRSIDKFKVQKKPVKIYRC